MKKSTLYKKSLVLLASAAVLGSTAMSVVAPVSAMAEENTTQAAPVAEKEQTAAEAIKVIEAQLKMRAATIQVSTFEELESALKYTGISDITVMRSFQFKRNISYVPIKEVTVKGDNPYVQLYTNNYAIYGVTSKVSTGNITFSGLDIISNDSSGRLFQASAGWDVRAEDMTFTGARFVLIPQGKLTFAGTNSIKSARENAYVHDLEFEANSVYDGASSTINGYNHASFYFNGSYVNGKTTGTVDVGEEAKVTIKNSPQGVVNATYPAFYGLVQKVNVGDSAVLDIDSAGPAIMFKNYSNYADGYASMNLSENSIVNLNGRGGKNQPTMYLQTYNARINVPKNATLKVSGSSTVGVVDSRYKGAFFNLVAPKEVTFTNRLANNKLFYGTDTTINGSNMVAIHAWNQIGGAYNQNPAEIFTTAYFQTTFGKNNSVTTNVLGDLSSQFKMQNYGQISLKGNTAN